MNVLERINQPADLLRLSDRELGELAKEIRQVILKTVAANQGHLSSNLGVVELTIALHRVFESPRDKLLWDVGHQCYAHKLLTGRRDRFATLRRLGGLSGFPKPGESPHDWFHTGHAGTSLSSAMGMAVARDLQGQDFKVVAVIGDGSLPNGMAMEAVNQIGQLKPDLIVVLNDNELAISRTTGAMAAYLSRIMAGTFYSRLREGVQRFLKRFRRVGPPVMHLAKHLEEEIKGLGGPGVLFEELGFRYLGPFDGNDLKELTEVFRKVKSLKGPTLVHVVTKKGKGFAPAEADPIAYYAPSPTFDVVTGRIQAPERKVPSYSDVLTDTMIKLAEDDPRIIAVTAAMLEGTRLKRFQARFPDRTFDVGMAEEHAVTFAAGAASLGLRPVVAMYSTFLQRGYDQVMHDVCLQHLPVTLTLDRAGLVGEDGPTHHGVFDFAYLRHLPGMVVMAPADENELARMMATAVRLNQPAAVRFPRGEITGTPMELMPTPLPVGRGRVLREGHDLALVSVGNMLACALEVAERLEREHGLKAAVADARFVKPLDEDLLAELAGRCGRIVTLEEHARLGGFGSAVLEALAGRGVRADVLVIGLPDAFVEHGSLKQLRERYGLAPGPVFERVLDFSGLSART